MDLPLSKDIEEGFEWWYGGELFRQTVSGLGRREHKAANQACFCVAVPSPALRRRGIVAMELLPFILSSHLSSWTD